MKKNCITTKPICLPQRTDVSSRANSPPNKMSTALNQATGWFALILPECKLCSAILHITRPHNSSHFRRMRILMLIDILHVFATQSEFNTRYPRFYRKDTRSQGEQYNRRRFHRHLMYTRDTSQPSNGTLAKRTNAMLGGRKHDGTQFGESEPFHRAVSAL